VWRTSCARDISEMRQLRQRDKETKRRLVKVCFYVYVRSLEMCILYTYDAQPVLVRLVLVCTNCIAFFTPTPASLTIVRKMVHVNFKLKIIIY
jgi:hypothetical protein